MKPRKVTQRDLDFWKGEKAVIKAPDGQEDEVDPIEAVLQLDKNRILTPWVLDERDYQDTSLEPFTVWLNSWGGMPPTDIIILKNNVGEATADVDLTEKE